MKIKPQGNNKTIIISDNGNELFFSYEACVAAKIDNVYYRTAEKFSQTTTKHINQYQGLNGIVKPQGFFETLIK